MARQSQSAADSWRQGTRLPPIHDGKTPAAVELWKSAHFLNAKETTVFRKF